MVLPKLLPTFHPFSPGMDKAEALAYVSRLFDAAAGRRRALGGQAPPEAIP